MNEKDNIDMRRLTEEDLSQINAGASSAGIDGRVRSPEEVVFKYKVGDRVTAWYLALTNCKGVITNTTIHKLKSGIKKQYTVYRPMYYVKFDSFFAINGWYSEDHINQD